jgi:hypothetical protein
MNRPRGPETRLRRRDEGHEGCADGFLGTWWRGRERSLGGQHLGAKAREATRERPTTCPVPVRRRNRAVPIGNSCEAAGGPEVPVNSREAA